MSRQLAAILIQFPQSFNRSDNNRRYLAALLDQLHDLPIAVEFRSASWAVDKVFDGLAQRRVTLVAVDEPNLPGLFPPLDVVTNPEFFTNFFTSAFMAVMPKDGVPATCRTSLIMIIQMPSCPNGWIKES